MNLSAIEALWYFLEGLEGDSQAYIYLNQPESLQQADMLGRMKQAVNHQQKVFYSTKLVSHLETLLFIFSAKLADNNKVVAA